MLASEIGLNPAGRPDDRQKQASFIEAFMRRSSGPGARRRTTPSFARQGCRARCRSRTTWPCSLPSTAYFELSKDFTPSHTLVEFRLDMIEQGEVKGEILHAITSLADVQEGRLGATIKNAGAVRVRTGSQEVKMPTDESSLRCRLKFWGFSFLFAQLKQPRRLWLKDVEPQVIYKYMDHLFGEHVMGLEAKDPNGRVVWSLEAILRPAPVL